MFPHLKFLHIQNFHTSEISPHIKFLHMTKKFQRTIFAASATNKKYASRVLIILYHCTLVWFAVNTLSLTYQVLCSLQIFQINRCCALLMRISLFGHQIPPLFCLPLFFTAFSNQCWHFFRPRLAAGSDVHFGIIVIHCNCRQRQNAQNSASY